MVVKFRGKCREFIVIYNHGKPLGTVLTDERFNDTECFTRAGSSHDPRPAERVADTDPSLAELPLVIVAHRDIHAVFVLLNLFALLETLVLEVEAVLHQALLDELGDIVQGYMYQYHSHERSRHV